MLMTTQPRRQCRPAALVASYLSINTLRQAWSVVNRVDVSEVSGVRVDVTVS
jgi:hypothetical protein